MLLIYKTNTMLFIYKIKSLESQYGLGFHIIASNERKICCDFLKPLLKFFHHSFEVRNSLILCSRTSTSAKPLPMLFQLFLLYSANIFLEHVRVAAWSPRARSKILLLYTSSTAVYECYFSCKATALISVFLNKCDFPVQGFTVSKLGLWTIKSYTEDKSLNELIKWDRGCQNYTKAGGEAAYKTPWRAPWQQTSSSWVTCSTQIYSTLRFAVTPC